jgi:hypothetical protein
MPFFLYGFAHSRELGFPQSVKISLHSLKIKRFEYSPSTKLPQLVQNLTFVWQLQSETTSFSMC